MHVLHPSSTTDLASWGAPDAVLDQARALLRATGESRTLLRGKHFGLLCTDAGHAAAVLFREAASELGARVSQVVPTLLETDTAQTVGDTARMLGRLYDAVECQGLSVALVQSLRTQAGIPVFTGIATAEHPSALLVDGLEGALAERRRCVLQAVLIVSLS